MKWMDRCLWQKAKYLKKPRPNFVATLIRDSGMMKKTDELVLVSRNRCGRSLKLAEDSLNVKIDFKLTNSQDAIRSNRPTDWTRRLHKPGHTLPHCSTQTDHIWLATCHKARDLEGKLWDVRVFRAEMTKCIRRSQWSPELRWRTRWQVIRAAPPAHRYSLRFLDRRRFTSGFGLSWPMFTMSCTRILLALQQAGINSDLQT